MFTFTRFGRRLVRVDLDGICQGWLEQSSHKPTGLHTKRYTIWSGTVGGVEFRAATLTALIAKINGAFVIETTYESRYGADGNVKVEW